MIETILTSTAISGAASALIRLWDQYQRDKHEREIALINRDIEDAKDRQHARQFISDGPTKKYIACVGVTVWAFTKVFPMITQAFGVDVTLTYSYYEWKNGFLFFSEGKDVVKTIVTHGGFWTDLDSAIFGLIIGALFGGSIAKRR